MLEFIIAFIFTAIFVIVVHHLFIKSATKIPERLLFLINTHGIFNSGGLCWYINLLHDKDLISRKECKAFGRWIKRNRPTSRIYLLMHVEDRVGSPFYFEFDDFETRKDWLKFLIDSSFLIK